LAVHYSDEYGFGLGEDDKEEDYQRLTDAWRGLLK